MSDEDSPSMPNLVEDSSSGPHNKATCGPQLDEESEDESDCQSDGFGELFSPLNIGPNDSLQALLSSLGHPYFDKDFLSGFRPGFLSGSSRSRGAGNARLALPTPPSKVRKSRAVKAPVRKQPARSGSLQGANPAIQSSGLGDKGDISDARLPKSSGNVQMLPAADHVAALEQQLQEAQQKLEHQRQLMQNAEQTRQSLEELHGRESKLRKAHEAELSLLREISRAEQKKERKLRGKQMKKAALAPAASSAEQREQVLECQGGLHDAPCFDPEPPVSDLPDIPDWLVIGEKVVAQFYGSWYPGTVRRILEDQQPVQVDVKWDGEDNRSIVDLPDVKLRGIRDTASTVNMDFDSPDEDWGCLTVRTGDRLFVRLSGNSDWVFAQVADRPAELGWVPSAVLREDCPLPDLSSLERPSRDGFCSVADESDYGQSPEKVLICDALLKMLASEHRAFDAEMRASVSESRVQTLESQLTDLREEVLYLVRTQNSDKLEERLRLAEQRAEDMEQSLVFLQRKSSTGEGALEQEQAKNARLLQECNHLRCEVHQAMEYVKKLRLEYAPTVEKLSHRDQLVRELYPALHETVLWIEEGNLERSMQQAEMTVKVPVLALRWSHDTVSSNACFSDGRSIYFAVDELLREQRDPDSWFRNGKYYDLPDVVPHDGCLYVATANRRLTALMMVQSLNRDKVIQVSCKMHSTDSPRWHDKLLGCPSTGRQPALNTTSRGYSVSFGRKRNAVSEHNHVPLFNAEVAAYRVLGMLFEGVPTEHSPLSAVKLKLKRRGHRSDESEIVRTVDSKSLEDVLRQRPRAAG